MDISYLLGLPKSQYVAFEVSLRIMVMNGRAREEARRLSPTASA